jgi:hypothetical protein
MTRSAAANGAAAIMARKQRHLIADIERFSTDEVQRMLILCEVATIPPN